MTERILRAGRQQRILVPGGVEDIHGPGTDLERGHSAVGPDGRRVEEDLDGDDVERAGGGPAAEMLVGADPDYGILRVTVQLADVLSLGEGQDPGAAGERQSEEQHDVQGDSG